MKIESNKISVIIQGPIKTDTSSCIASVKKFLPHSEIILSTWDTEHIPTIELDKLIKSKCPAAYTQCKNKSKNNLNRLIRSSKEGIKYATRSYILKIRSDLILESNKFLDTFNCFPKTGEKKLFKHKILLPSIYSRTNYRGFPTPFHLSDWACFGLAEDVKALFSAIDETNEPSFTQYYLTNDKTNPFYPNTYKMAPEQYIFYSIYRKSFKDFTMENSATISYDLIDHANDFIVSNFIIASFKDTGFFLTKYPESKNDFMLNEEYFELWTKCVYESIYKQKCDKKYTITDIKGLHYFKYKEYNIQKIKIKKHWHHFMEVNNLLKKINQLFIILRLLPVLVYKYIKGLVRQNYLIKV